MLHTIIKVQTRADLQPIRLQKFTIYAAQMMLIGCLEREFFKKGLIFDVNSLSKVTL